MTLAHIIIRATVRKAQKEADRSERAGQFSR
jgi:hypothetical protein